MDPLGSGGSPPLAPAPPLLSLSLYTHAKDQPLWLAAAAPSSWNLQEQAAAGYPSSPGTAKVALLLRWVRLAGISGVGAAMDRTAV